jgi:hypothetical protein
VAEGHVGANGLLMQFCTFTGWWEVWTVMWVIEPLSLALSFLVINARRPSPGLLRAGTILLVLSVLAVLRSLCWSRLLLLLELLVLAVLAVLSVPLLLRLEAVVRLVCESTLLLLLVPAMIVVSSTLSISAFRLSTSRTYRRGSCEKEIPCSTSSRSMMSASSFSMREMYRKR